MVIPKNIEVDLGNGKYASISVEVPWYPQRCTRCCIFGHTEKTCPCKPVVTNAKVWKPKQNEPEVCLETEAETVKDEVTECYKEKKESKGKSVNMKEIFSTPQAESSNRFTLLSTVMEKEDKWQEGNCNIENDYVLAKQKFVVEVRKSRAASAGVAELMKTLKPRKKGLIDKEKAKISKDKVIYLEE